MLVCMQGRMLPENNNSINLDSHLSFFGFPVMPWICRLPSTPALLQCLVLQKPQAARCEARDAQLSQSQAFYIVCSLHFGVITQWYKSAYTRVGGGGGNNCAINDCYFDYRMQLSLRLEANQRVVSGSPLVLSNGP